MCIGTFRALELDGKEQRNILADDFHGYYLSEGFRAHWFTTLVKDSMHTSLLP